MIQRCTNQHTTCYAQYGGRGIGICQDWRHDFLAFFADMGPRPIGCSLDRIDPNGNYEPSNCRWGDAKQQTQNRRPRRKRKKAAKARAAEPHLDDPPF